MNYYKVSIFTYNEFLKEYKNNNLKKFHKIYTGKGIPKGLILNEIFDKFIEDVDFEIKTYQHPQYSNEKNTIYFFKTKNNNEYRLDFVILKEDNSNLQHKELYNKKFISIGFSRKDATSEDYDQLTNRNEQYDLFNRIIFLINNYKSTINNDYIFMFGEPNDKKFNIYKFILEKCFPNYKIIKDYTSGFNNSKLGFYLI